MCILYSACIQLPDSVEQVHQHACRKSWRIVGCVKLSHASANWCSSAEQAIFNKIGALLLQLLQSTSRSNSTALRVVPSGLLRETYLRFVRRQNHLGSHFWKSATKRKNEVYGPFLHFLGVISTDTSITHTNNKAMRRWILTNKEQPADYHKAFKQIEEINSKHPWISLALSLPLNKYQLGASTVLST